MDVRLLADSLTQILAPALPCLAGRGREELPNGAPGDMEKAKVLWSRLRQKLEEKPSAAESIQDLVRVPEDLDAQAALRIQLRKLLEGDSVLAEQMASLIESDGTTMSPGARAAVHSSGAVAQGAGGIAIGRLIAGDALVGSMRAKSRD
jgi:hypothetical protein